MSGGFGGQGMDLFIQLAVMVVLGSICAVIANQRGRSAVGWFFVGFFAGCIGLILVLVLPDLKAQEERERRLAQENRRLKEQLRKDRVVADQRHADVQKRLGVHDRALGVDTSGLPELPEPAPAHARVSVPASVPASVAAASWWYARDGKRLGPVTFGALRSLWSSAQLNDDTLVWTDGMGEWKSIGDHLPLRDALDA